MLKELFKPFKVRESDIWGNEDLNDFLEKIENREIVEQHYKLWITSTSVLEIIFNNAIKGRSKYTINEIKENSYKYALTENHTKGLEILKEKNVVIITGEPGIGKTTLANNLALTYVAKGYEFCDIEENISEAESLFNEDEKKKILFYFDDFLGSNFYDAISNKRDSHISKFIKRVSQDKSKKFILTSRTSILNKAYNLSHRFQNDKIRDNEFLLSVTNLTNLDKAMILYNHIYHSKLNSDFIDKIYQDKRYREIIKHRNFNPRIIEFVTDSRRLAGLQPEDYWEYIKHKLEHPEDIWDGYFQTQTDETVRILVYLTVFNRGRIKEDTLQEAYATFLKNNPITSGDSFDRSFNAVRKLAITSLLNRNQTENNEYEYTLFNPSIADFILTSYSPETELIIDVLCSLGTTTSLEYLRSLSSSSYGKITIKQLKVIQSRLFDFFLQNKLEDEDWDYLILLSNLTRDNPKSKKHIIKFLEKIINTPDASGNRLSGLITVILNHSESIKIKEFHFLYGFIENYLEEYDLQALVDFIDKFKIVDKEILNEVEIHIENYLIEQVRDSDIDYSKHLREVYYSDSFVDYDLNEDSVKNELCSEMESKLENFNQTTLGQININIDYIINNIDVHQMYATYIKSLRNDYDDIEYNHTSSLGDDIDSIFER
ncbi:MAG: hypothetical protein ACO1PI_09485 [Bacteroidota bacterium]